MKKDCQCKNSAENISFFSFFWSILEAICRVKVICPFLQTRRVKHNRTKTKTKTKKRRRWGWAILSWRATKRVIVTKTITVHSYHTKNVVPSSYTFFKKFASTLVNLSFIVHRWHISHVNGNNLLNVVRTIIRAWSPSGTSDWALSASTLGDLVVVTDQPLGWSTKLSQSQYVKKESACSASLTTSCYLQRILFLFLRSYPSVTNEGNTSYQPRLGTKPDMRLAYFSTSKYLQGQQAVPRRYMFNSIGA